MKKDKHIYLKLFFSTFQLSAFTIGSGFVIVALMRKKFVEELQWIDEQEMMDLTAIAQSSPGAIVVNASFLIGYRVAGYRGALVTVLGTILPPILIITMISFFYDAFRTNPVVATALSGMRIGVAAIICDVVFSMGKSSLKDKRALPIIIFMIAFLANQIFHVNVIWIILASGLIGIIDHYIQRRKKGSDPS